MTPNVPSPPKPSWGLTLLAGGFALLGAPFGLLAFALRALWRGAEEGGHPLREAWAEGGDTMIVVAASALLLAPVGALLAMVAARRHALAAIFLPMLCALPAIIGQLGRDAALGGALLAVEHVNPADRQTIVIASVAEAQWASTLGGLMAAGLAFALALALLTASRAQRRNADPVQPRALLSGAVLLMLLGAVALVGALGARALGDGMRVLTNLSPADVPAVAKELVPGLHAFEHAYTAFTVLAVTGMLLLAWRLGPRTGPRLGLLAYFGASLGLVYASAQPLLPDDLRARLRNPRQVPERLRFDAPSVRESAGLDLPEIWDDEARESLRQSVEAAVMLRAVDGSEETALALSLSPGATQEALWSALEIAAQANVTAVVLLTGREANASAALPAPFDIANATPNFGVSVSVDYREGRCAEPCALAQLTADALEVEGERWPLEERADEDTALDGAPVYLAYDPRPPRELLRAALTTMKRGRPLVVLLEGERPGRPSHRSDDEGDLSESGTPPPLFARFEVLKLTVQGPLDAATARSALSAALEGQQSCAIDEEGPPKLPRTLNLELAVTSSGMISTAEPSNPDDALEDCVSGALRTELEFAPPKKRGLSILRVALRASALPGTPSPP